MFSIENEVYSMHSLFIGYLISLHDGCRKKSSAVDFNDARLLYKDEIDMNFTDVRKYAFC